MARDAESRDGTKRIDSARKGALHEIDEIEKRTSPPVPKDAVSVLIASEIRSAFANMQPNKRQATIQTAIENGEDEVIGALCSGALMLSGMTKIEREMVRHTWRKIMSSDTESANSSCNRMIKSQARQRTTPSIAGIGPSSTIRARKA